MIKAANRKHPLAKVIAVDVDDTLVTNGVVDQRLVEWCKRKRMEGFHLILWSAAGEVHAKKMAVHGLCSHIFHTIISKPGYIIDDKGWSWTKFTRRITKWGK